MRSEEVISWRRMIEGVDVGRALMSWCRYSRARVMRAWGLDAWKSMFHDTSLMVGRVG